jgi:hypothetical protein
MGLANVIEIGLRPIHIGKKGNTSRNKCVAAGPRKRKGERERETSYTTGRVARLMECVLSGTTQRRKERRTEIWKRHEMC